MPTIYTSAYDRHAPLVILTTMSYTLENIYKSEAEKTNELYDMTTVKRVHWNLLNLNEIEVGKYVASDGRLYDNSAYTSSGFVNVEEGKTYTLQTSNSIGSRRISMINQIVGYNANKVVVANSFKSYVNEYTVPSDVAYIRFSSDAAFPWMPMFVEGVSVVEYEDYSDKPHYKRFVKSDSIILPQFVPNGYEFSFNLASGTKEKYNTIINNITGYSVVFRGNIGTTFTGVRVGKGDASVYGYAVGVDGVNLTVYGGANSTQTVQVPHGLTFKDYILIRVTAIKGTADIEVFTNGGSFAKTVNWDARMGDLYVQSYNGNSEITDCKLSYFCDGFNNDSWLFGDSYFSASDPSRWTTYLIRSGKTNYMLDSYGGRQSESALISLRENLKRGMPKRIVWCMGMNDADSDSSVSTSWLNSFNAVKEICELNDIELIASTIPNVPTVNHVFKNEIVRNSGLRYIDFAVSVGATEKGSTWYDNMLYSDNIHPAIEGAKALYSQAISDVPELLS